jgi:pectate lyase
MEPPQLDGQCGGEPPASVEGVVFMPYATADSSLRVMAGQAEGFGRHAIGGLHGDVYHVTTLEGTYTNTHKPMHIPSPCI